MEIFRRTTLLASFAGAVLAAVALGCGNPTAERPAAAEANSPLATNLALLDAQGQAANPFSDSGAKATVFIFVSTDCPISNRYAPEIRRLRSRFEAEGIRFHLVYPNGDETPDSIRQHLADYQLDLPALRDPAHALVRHAGVKVTPEAAVFTSPNKLIYRGRIDDRNVDFGKTRTEPTRRDLQEVLESIVAGNPPSPRSTPAIGCYIASP